MYKKHGSRDFLGFGILRVQPHMKRDWQAGPDASTRRACIILCRIASHPGHDLVLEMIDMALRERGNSVPVGPSALQLYMWF